MDPFYVPDDHSPITANSAQKLGSTQIVNRRFIQEVKRIAGAWYPGVTSI